MWTYVIWVGAEKIWQGWANDEEGALKAAILDGKLEEGEEGDPDVIVGRIIPHKFRTPAKAPRTVVR